MTHEIGDFKIGDSVIVNENADGDAEDDVDKVGVIQKLNTGDEYPIFVVFNKGGHNSFSAEELNHEVTHSQLQKLKNKLLK